MILYYAYTFMKHAKLQAPLKQFNFYCLSIKIRKF